MVCVCGLETSITWDESHDDFVGVQNEGGGWADVHGDKMVGDVDGLESVGCLRGVELNQDCVPVGEAEHMDERLRGSTWR